MEWTFETQPVLVRKQPADEIKFIIIWKHDMTKHIQVISLLAWSVLISKPVAMVTHFIPNSSFSLRPR